MKLVCLLLCITYVNCFYTVSENNLATKDKIFRGGISRGSHYFYAALYYVQKLFCGATIITYKWLLSGEICFIQINNVTDVKVRYGYSYDSKVSLSSLKSIASVKRYSEDFPESDVNTNLLLILLAESIMFDLLSRPIQIIHSNKEFQDLMRIIGHGKIQDSDSRTSAWLREGFVRVLESSHCPAASNRLFCAEATDIDPCIGDQGGPGIMGDKLAAIITGEPTCGRENISFYTKVSPFYSWIENKTKLIF